MQVATTFRIVWLIQYVVLAGTFFLSVAIFNVSANSELPIATTVSLEGMAGTPGMVVRYDEDVDTYRVSDMKFDPTVYGVVGERPAIVFVTASNTIPVVTEGVSMVLVDAKANGSIVRGDLLTTSGVSGVAMRATLETDEVFAIALEDWSVGEGLLVSEIGTARAKAIQKERQALAAAKASAEEEGVTRRDTTSMVRIAVAIVLTVGALGFLLYSFRSILNSSVLSVGRNPRARSSVVWLSVGSLAMVLVVVVTVIFVALGVLVLPI